MKLRRSILACSILSLLIFSALAFPVFAQTESSDQTKPHGQTTTQSEDVASASISEELKPGIVVERVEKNSESEKAGLKQGDLLLSWSRGDVKGEIQSPFDLSDIEIEQAPRGNVILEGFRDTEKRTWTLGPDDWDIKARPNFPQNLLSVYREGQELVKAGKLSEAVERWQSAAVEAHKSPSTWLSAWLFFYSAGQLADAKESKEADDAYQKAVQQIGISALVEAQLLRAWAADYRGRGDLPSAEKYFQQAATESQKLERNPSLFTAAILSSLCEASTARSEFAKAREYCNQALSIQQKIAPDSLPMVNTLNNLSSVDIIEGDITASDKHLSQALAIVQKVAPGSLLEANTLYRAGVDGNYTGDLAMAENHLNRALVLQKNHAPASLDVGNTLVMLGNVSCLRGELAKAENYYLQALAIRQKFFPEISKSTGILNNLGNVAWQRGDLAKAEDYYRQVLTIRQKQQPDSINVAYVLLNLGQVTRDRGDDVAAAAHLEHALAILMKLAPESLDTADTFIDLGDVAKDRRDWAKAEEYYLQGLRIREKQAPDSVEMAVNIQGLGDVATGREDLVKAEQYYRRALAILEKNAPESSTHAESLFALAGIMRRKQQPEAAAQFYEQSLQTLESQTARLGGGEETRSGFRAKYISYYKGYIDLLLQQKKPETAFQVLERLRARTLLETLAQVHADILKGVDPALVDKERSLQESISARSSRRMQLSGNQQAKEQLAALDKEISELLAQYKDVEEQITTTSPTYAALTRPQPLGAKEVQQQILDDNTLLLEYSLGQERSYVFAVTPDSLNAYELPKSVEIEPVARRAYQLLTEHNHKSKNETGRQVRVRVASSEFEYSQTISELSRMVLGPIAGQLQGKRLLIVSDGALQYIPFAVLPVSSGSGPNQSVPLVAEHEIVNLPSASVLAVLRREELERKEASKAVAILADPVFAAKDDRVSLTLNNSQPNNNNPATAHTSDPQALPGVSEQSDLDRSAQQLGINSFPRLPFTRREADAISSIAPAGDVTEDLDFDASKATALSAQLKNYRIVHFATHGLLNNEHPELSGLVFSLVDKQGNEQDGFLRMLDIYNMDLNADLVVLSACQTALGKEIGEEGLVGLTRGFMYAGAPRVVASLWKVDDEATAELMKKFYESMLRDHQSPAQALRNAQQWMRTQKAWQSPYYWAGFVLQGEWK
jgi:CHAT domain-containing protein/Tfp pilus assembly protein PilF